MTANPRHRPHCGSGHARTRNWAACFLVALAAPFGGCAVGVDGGPPYVDAEVGYVGGYYEPYGYEVGGWGSGYHVGPGRGGERGGGRSTHTYRAAPSGHGAPSIPSRSRRR